MGLQQTEGALARGERAPHAALNRTYISKEGQHFVVRGVVGNKKPEIGIVENGGDSNQTGPAPGHDGDILPAILTGFALAMMCVVEVGNGHPQRFDSGGGAILSATHGDVDILGPFKAALDVIVDFGRALSQVADRFLVSTPGFGWLTTECLRPCGGIVGEAMLVGPLGTPDDAGGGARRIESCMRTMSLVGTTELTMDDGIEFAGSSSG